MSGTMFHLTILADAETCGEKLVTDFSGKARRKQVRTWAAYPSQGENMIFNLPRVDDDQARVRPEEKHQCA